MQDLSIGLVLVRATWSVIWCPNDDQAHTGDNSEGFAWLDLKQKLIFQNLEPRPGCLTRRFLEEIQDWQRIDGNF